jgi:hypothetical protein
LLPEKYSSEIRPLKIIGAAANLEYFSWDEFNKKVECKKRVDGQVVSFYSEQFSKNEKALITFKFLNEPGEHLYFGITSSKHTEKGANMPASGNVILFDGGTQE